MRFQLLQGTRFLLSGQRAGQVYLLDTTNPKRVRHRFSRCSPHPPPPDRCPALAARVLAPPAA
jgi:hypothetical protein